MQHGTLDVDALYPNIRLDIALSALKDALDTVTDFPEEYKNMIIYLAKLCIENSVLHYRGKWHRSKEGLPTGGPESGSLANLVVYFCSGKDPTPLPRDSVFEQINIMKKVS